MRIQDLQTEKAVAEKDYKEAIGKLRYAINLHHSKTVEAAEDNQIPSQNGASSLSGAAQQTGAGPLGVASQAGGSGLGAVGDAGAGPSGVSQQEECVAVAPASNEHSQPGAHSDKENAEAPDIVSNAADDFQLPEEALELHRKIATATASLLAQPMEEAPAGAEECPVCNEYMLNKYAFTILCPSRLATRTMQKPRGVHDVHAFLAGACWHSVGTGGACHVMSR